MIKIGKGGVGVERTQSSQRRVSLLAVELPKKRKKKKTSGEKTGQRSQGHERKTI